MRPGSTTPWRAPTGLPMSDPVPQGRSTCRPLTEERGQIANSDDGWFHDRLVAMRERPGAQMAEAGLES